MSLTTATIKPDAPRYIPPPHLGKIHPWIAKRDPLREHFRPLTIPFELPDELWMLEAVIADMERGEIPHMLVGTAEEVEVWRTTKGYRTGARDPYEDQ